MARRGARHREAVRPLPQAHRHCRYGGRPRRLHLCPLWDAPVDRHGRRRQAHRPHHVLYGCRGLSPHQEHPALSGQAGGLCRRQLLPLPLFLRHGSAGADESPAAECHLHHLPGGTGRLGAPPPLARTPPGRPAPPAGLPEHPRRLGHLGLQHHRRAGLLLRRLPQSGLRLHTGRPVCRQYRQPAHRSGLWSALSGRPVQPGGLPAGGGKPGHVPPPAPPPVL